MIKKFATALVTGSLVFFASGAFAGEDHPHDAGPNGGVVVGFGEKNHIEAVRSGETVTLHVLGGDGTSAASIAKVSSGTVTIIGGGKPGKKTEIKSGASFSEMTVSAPAKGPVTVSIKLKSGSDSLSAKVNFKK